MAKGQKRGNREIRKPKSDTPKVTASAPTTSGVAMAFASTVAKKKK